MTKLKKNKINSDDYKKIGRYLTLPFQMLAIIAFFVFLGIKADKWLVTKFPVFTVLSVFIGVPLAIFYAVKDLKK